MQRENANNANNQPEGLECLSSFITTVVIHNPVKSSPVNHFCHSLISCLPVILVGLLKEQSSSFVPLLHVDD